MSVPIWTVMERDASAGRKGRPHLFTDMRRGAGIEDVVAFIEETGGLRAATAARNRLAAGAPVQSRSKSGRLLKAERSASDHPSEIFR
jgi:hypothetical protein